jgi:hypothetical protein
MCFAVTRPRKGQITRSCIAIMTQKITVDAILLLLLLLYDDSDDDIVTTNYLCRSLKRKLVS